MSDGKSRIHFDDLEALFYRFVVRMREEKKLRQICVDDQGQRIQTFRFSHFHKSLLGPTQQAQIHSIPMVSGCIAWVQFNSSPELFPGRVEIPVEGAQAVSQ